jgi:hypothetical protein
MTRTARLAGAALTACLLSAAPAPAQEPAARYPFWGTHAFRHILRELKLQPVQTAGRGGAPPGKTVLIVLGDPRGLDEAAQRVGGLARFREASGAVLIATDQDDGGRLADLGLRVSGERVAVPRSLARLWPQLVHAGERVCPVVRDFEDPQHPIFRGIRALVSNQPSRFVVAQQGTDLRLLARLPEGCSTVADELDRAFPGRPGVAPLEELPFIFGTGPDEARALLLADHDLFVDGMMLRRHTNNFEFAVNCVRWLTNDGERKHVLLIENGVVVTDLGKPLTRLPQMPFPSLKALGKLVRGLEEANVVNGAILSNVPRGRILRHLFLAASGWLLAYGLIRLVRAHQRTEPAPRVAAKVEKQAAAGDLPLVARRTESVAREGNCYEAARDLARLCFEGDSGEPPETPPAVVGGRGLRREVERLWRLAYGATPTPVSPREFAALAATVARVRAALGR